MSILFSNIFLFGIYTPINETKQIATIAKITVTNFNFFPFNLNSSSLMCLSFFIDLSTLF